MAEMNLPPGLFLEKAHEVLLRQGCAAILLGWMVEPLKKVGSGCG